MTTKSKRLKIPRTHNGNIKLMLIEDVPHLGKQGEIVEVRPGYARNYLLPNSLAAIPTEHNLKRLERYKERVQAALEAKIADLRVLAEQIARLNINIEANADENGHLYGSVGPKEISKALKARNLNVEIEMVKLDGVFKECGLYEVPLNLGYNIETKVQVTVLRAVEKR
jgi:large subunit ribosomal protein L9